MTRTLSTLQIGMKKVLHRGGGLDRYYFNLLQNLPAQHVEVVGLIAGQPSDELVRERVHAFATEFDPMLLSWLKMRRFAPAYIGASDIVVSHFAPHTLPLLNKLQGKPLIVHFHGPWSLEGAIEGKNAVLSALKKTIEATVYRAATRVIVLSSAFAELLTDQFGVKADRIRIVPGGVNINALTFRGSRREARERLRWPADRPTVVTVRRLVHAKGIENLIKAAALLKLRVPGIFIAIVGTGPLAESLQQSIVDAGLSDTVRLVGFVADEDLPTVYAAADLSVVPTLAFEGFGLVVIEALANGTPTLVTPVGGLPEVVRPLEPSLVLEGSKPEDIANGISRALQGMVRIPSSDECVAYAQQFGWDHIASRVAGVYRELA